jgi:hypothetical protein
MKNPLRIVTYEGRIFCDGLFAMHDQLGFPLACSVAECARRGWVPCLFSFRCDALRAGWSKERIDEVMRGIS